MMRNKSPLDEAYASLSKGNISSIDDSNCEGLQLQFRASSTPRQPSLSHSRLKSNGNKSTHIEEPDFLQSRTRLEYDNQRKDSSKNLEPSHYFHPKEEALSSGFDGDISADLCVHGKFNSSTLRVPKSKHCFYDEIQEQQSDIQPLDLRTNKTDACACTKLTCCNPNPARFDIQTLLGSNQSSTSIQLISQAFDSVANLNTTENYPTKFVDPSNMILRTMVEFFILLQQQQQQMNSKQSPTQRLPQLPKYSSHLSSLPMTCPNTFIPNSIVHDVLSLPGSDHVKSQLNWPTPPITPNHQPAKCSTDFDSQMKIMNTNWEFTDSEGESGTISRPKKSKSDENSNFCLRESSMSNYSDSVSESRDVKSESNFENDLDNKGPAIFYFPEPADSKEKIRTMIEQNDPRLKYVNDGAAIRNPFAVDRKTQLNQLTALLCIKLDNNCYLCKGCNRTTSRLRPMQQHLLSHSASKFNLCVQCLKGFNDKYDMKRHTRKHTLVRPYVCPECSRSFSQRCSLEGHRRKIHKIKLDYTPNQRREVVRVCENCGYACSRLADMVHHTATYHPASTSLPRLRRQLSRHEDRLKRDQRNSCSIRPFTNLLNTNEPNTEPKDFGFEMFQRSRSASKSWPVEMTKKQ